MPADKPKPVKPQAKAPVKPAKPPTKQPATSSSSSTAKSKKAPAKSKPPSPAEVAASKQKAIDSKLSGLLQKESKAAKPTPKSTVGESAKATSSKPTQSGGTAKAAPSAKPAGSGTAPPRKSVAPGGKAKAPSAPRPTSRRSTRNGNAFVDDEDEGEDDEDDSKTMEDYQADINDLCGLGEDGDEGSDNVSNPDVFPEPKGEPGRSSSGVRPGYNLQEGLGLGSKADQSNHKNNTLYKRILDTTRYGLKHFKFNPSQTKTKQDKRKEFAMYALLTREFPKIINTKRYPRLWCVPALTSYCFKNLRGYEKWKKPSLQKKKAEAAAQDEEEDDAHDGEDDDMPELELTDAAVPTKPSLSTEPKPRQSTPPPALKSKESNGDDDGYLSYLSEGGEEIIGTFDSQTTLVDVKGALKKEERNDEGDEGDDDEEDDEEDEEDEEEYDEATLRKFYKLQKLMQANPGIARAMSRARSEAPKKASKHKIQSGNEPVEEEEEEEVQPPAKKGRSSGNTPASDELQEIEKGKRKLSLEDLLDIDLDEIAIPKKKKRLTRKASHQIVGSDED